MIYTGESIWYKFEKNLFQLLFALILVLCLGTVFSQENSGSDWRIRFDVDNYVSVKNSWSTEEKVASIVVYDSNGTKLYALSFITIADEWNHFDFPDDFIELNPMVKDSALSPQTLIFEIRVKRTVELQKEYFFDPSPNSLLQLDIYTPSLKFDDDIIWGEFIDAYKWQDKRGENIVVRSNLNRDYIMDDSSRLFTKYIYLYHFIKENDSLILQRKFTDVIKGCNENPQGGFLLQSIELTDINRDTIGEFSTIYELFCSSEDTLNYRSKLLLTSEGKKFMLDAMVDPCNEHQRIVEYSKSSSFTFYPYLLRFMEEKLNQYHQF